MELQQARERAGLTAEDIATRTKFKLYKIEALERSDFGNLPHGIYLDGIVRAYARELDLDPEPLVERLRLERGKLPGDTPIPFEEPVKFERPIAGEAAPAAPIERHVPDRTAHAHSSIAFALLALLAVLGWGAYFYQAARGAQRDTIGKNYMALPAQTAPGAAPIAFTEPAVADAQEPAERELELELEPELAAPVRVANTPRSRRASNQNSARRPAPRASAARPIPAARPSAIPAPITEAHSGTATDVELTGSWRLATQVRSSSVARYAGLLLGYELQLEQDGDRVTGVGRKVIENGNGIHSRGQTPIAVNGVVEGDRLTLNFVEGGAQRSSQGTFTLTRNGGLLRGRFTSDAARSAGTVEARRVR
ncbi:MAG TPA: helix-turn-helix transcriptional regulator [Vicinamibacterales bacterium]|nr:helix-turn-helix transcriptional regulator [Vicinamibacterales bacterium]